MTTDVTYAIGDIHGCFYHLDRMLELIKKDKRPDETAEIVFVGDYIDRGPDSKRVLDRVMANDDGIPFICLKGNHEYMCVDAHFYGGKRVSENFDDYRIWKMNGGDATLASFETGKISDEYLIWMDKLPVDYENENYIFVHAGLPPQMTKEEADPYEKLWIREDFLYSNYNWGKPVVHGHTPLKEPVVRHNRISIDTGLCFGYSLTTAVLRGSNEPEFIQVPYRF